MPIALGISPAGTTLRASWIRRLITASIDSSTCEGLSSRVIRSRASEYQPTRVRVPPKSIASIPVLIPVHFHLLLIPNFHLCGDVDYKSKGRGHASTSSFVGV